jgi:hypothetical protein
MITFSSRPFSLATLALCSRWVLAMGLKRSRKKSFSAGRSGIFGSAGLSPIMNSVSG